MDSVGGKVLSSVCSMVLLFLPINSEQHDCTEIRLYGGRHGEGRAEIKCDDQWGTISSSSDTNVDKVICRDLGFGQNWLPKRMTEFDNGQGPVWMVTCTGEESLVVNCSITKNEDQLHTVTEYPTYEFWDHNNNDLGIKCRGQYKGESTENDNEGTADDGEHDGKIVPIVVINVIGFAFMLAANVLCWFLIYRRFTAGLHAKKGESNSRSQTMLSSTFQETVETGTTRRDLAEESTLIDTEQRDSTGCDLTEINPLYEAATELNEPSLISRGQKGVDMRETPAGLTELNPCYESAGETTVKSITV